MSNGNTPRDEADLDTFLKRESPLSTAYDALEPVQPPEVLDAKILAIARGAGAAAPGKAAPAARPAAPAADNPVAPKPAAAAGAPAVPKAPAARPAAVEADDEDDDAPPARRPRWLVPAALAASVLVAVGVGVGLLGGGSSGTGEDPGAASPLGSLFAKRARERSEAEKAAEEAAAADAASREAEVVELAPLPPPPVFEPEGPQVEDLDTAIALIRKELVLANQMAAMTDGSAGRAADVAPAAPASVPDGADAIIQSRDRRLTKILELYDGGNPDLAAASLEIFLRDFEDDPISQRILDAQPRATDVAVE